MTMPTPDIVVSGYPYAVLEVGGREPADLTDFEGGVELVLDGKTGHKGLVGESRVDGESARLHEKGGPGGKDIRVWTIRPGDDGGFVALAD